MTSKEFDVDCAFSGTNYTVLKRMFEGIGATVSENKFIEFKKQFEGLQFIIASNKLPRCSNHGHADYRDMWEPMELRMIKVYLGKSHVGTEFPYTPA